jgi:hypothetical protein
MVSSNQRYHLINNAVDVEQLLSRLGVVHQRTDASDHFGSPIPLLDDPPNSPSRFIQIWNAPVEPTQAGSRGIDDRGEWLIHLM